MDMTEHLYPVILAGGSGTRFWPLSRHLYPKQLLRIIGDETLIQQTMRRVLSCAKPEQVIISTNPGQADSIRVQLGEWKSALISKSVISSGVLISNHVAFPARFISSNAYIKSY